MVKLYNAWLSEVPERDILDKYGMCCDVPALLCIYSIDDVEKLRPVDGDFIRYECAICGQFLYVSDNEFTKKVGEWV